MKNYIYISILFLIFSSCKNNTEKDFLKKYDIEFNDYEEIINIILADSSNIFIIPGDYKNTSRPRQITILDSTVKWPENRFVVSLFDRLFYKLSPESQELNPFNRTYIFKGELKGIISKKNMRNMEVIANRLQKEIIRINPTDKYRLVNSNQQDSLTLGLSRPIISENNKYMFVNYYIYLNPYGKTTNISDDIYSNNILILKKKDNGIWTKFKQLNWLIL